MVEKSHLGHLLINQVNIIFHYVFVRTMYSLSSMSISNISKIKGHIICNIWLVQCGIQNYIWVEMVHFEHCLLGFAE